MWTSWWHYKKCQEVTKASRIHGLRTIKVSTKFHGNPSCRYWHILIWTKKWWTDWPADRHWHPKSHPADMAINCQLFQGPAASRHYCSLELPSTLRLLHTLLWVSAAQLQGDLQSPKVPFCFNLSLSLCQTNIPADYRHPHKGWGGKRFGAS